MNNNVLDMTARLQANGALPQLVVENPVASAALGMSADETELFEQIMQASYAHNKAKNYQDDSIGRDRGIIDDYIRFTGKAPWNCSVHDFEQYCVEIGVTRKLAVSTQRMYQGVIKRLYAYMLETMKLRNAIYVNFGVRVAQICTDENCIAHVHERELAKARSAMTKKQLNKFFTQLRKDIDEADKFNGKDRFAFRRDLAMFYLYYASGFRADEGLQINLDAFSENPDLAALGEYGLIEVWRKGSKGSGKKYQQVVMTQPGLRPMLDWYLSVVRSWYVDRAKNANDQSVFLSERGERLKYSAANERFKLALRRAGLDVTKFSLHSLRHTMATHELEQISIQALSQKLGHKRLTTTLTYVHLPDQQLKDELVRSAKRRLKAAGV